jgi:hypothetical protein
LDGGDEQPADRFLDYRFEDEGTISYLNALLPGIKIDKRVMLSADGIRAQYTVQNLSGRRRHLRWHLTHESSPDYAAVLLGGRAALEIQPELDEPKVVNTRTGSELRLNISRPVSEVTHHTNFLSVDLGLRFELDLPAQDAETFTLDLTGG